MNFPIFMRGGAEGGAPPSSGWGYPEIVPDMRSTSLGLFRLSVTTEIWPWIR